MKQPTKIAGIATGGILLAMSLISFAWPQHAAFGYGECSAPTELTEAQNPTHPKKVKLAWGQYDFSLCGQDLTTKSYIVEVRDLQNNLIITKTKTRNDKFSLPNAYQNINWKELGYHTAVQFRVRTVSDVGTMSDWSDYYEFTTIVQNPTLHIATVSNDSTTNTSTVKFSWDTISNPTDFKYYRLKVFQNKYIATDATHYRTETTTLLSHKFKDIHDVETQLTNLHELENFNDEAPRDQYTYTAKLFATYKINGEIVHSEKDIQNFGLDYAGRVNQYLTGPDNV